MGISNLQGIPWHFVSERDLKSNDSRRHRARCRYLKASNKCALFGRCGGSVHCENYEEMSQTELLQRRQDKQDKVRRSILPSSSAEKGCLYVVTDKSSGIKGQKVILVDTLGSNKYKVKLGNQVYIVRELGLIKQDQSPSITTIQTKPSSNDQKSLIKTEKTDKIKKSPVEIFQNIKKGESPLRAGDTVLILNHPHYHNYKGVFIEEKPRGYLLSVERNNKQREVVIPKKFVLKKK